MLKNITITADEKILRWAKKESAKTGVPVSKLVGQILAEEMRRRAAYWKAYEGWKGLKPVPMTAPVKFNREESHERGG